MSQRSHIAISGSTAICACSAACSDPCSTSNGKSSRSSFSGITYQSACVTKCSSGRSTGSRSICSWSLTVFFWNATTCSLTATTPKFSSTSPSIGLPARDQDVGVLRRQRQLVRRRHQVRQVDALGLVVEDRGLHGALEELVGVAAEELVESVVARDVHRQAGAAPPGAAPHLQ